MGFIEIGIERDDIYGKVYLPYSKNELGIIIYENLSKNFELSHRYYWNTTKKVFLDDIGVNGAHFRIADLHSNYEVIDKLTLLLSLLKERVFEFNKKYYIDFEAFYSVKNSVDYLKIYNSIISSD